VEESKAKLWYFWSSKRSFGIFGVQSEALVGGIQSFSFGIFGIHEEMIENE
jgi:hypothetical protein